MKQFKQIDLEIISSCTRKCIMCPKYSEKQKEIKKLPMSYIMKMVQELKKNHYNGEICFSGYCESTSDSRLPEIIKYIHSELPEVFLSMFTNGDNYKTSEQYIKLFENGLTGLYIDIYDEKSKTKIIHLSNEFKELYGENKFESNSENHLKRPEKAQITLIIVDKSLPLKLTGRSEIHNRAGNIPWFLPILKIPMQGACNRIFEYLTLRSNGDVVLCCDDYYHKIILGNIETETLQQIWEGQKISTYRNKMMNGNRNMLLCSGCNMESKVIDPAELKRMIETKFA